MLRIGLLVALVAGLAGAAFLLVFRPSVSVASTVAPAVTVECHGIGTEEECREYGDGVLSGEPPSNTFEIDDLTRLVIERPALGDASTCTVAWYIERYPDDPVWEAEYACGVTGG